MLPSPKPFMYCLIDNWVNSEYCYDGNFVFVTRNKNQ
jgi:hypothetical protein